MFQEKDEQSTNFIPFVDVHNEGVIKILVGSHKSFKLSPEVI
jgi:hypothetical protein